MTGPDFAVSLRISQWKVQDFQAKNFNTPAELEEFARIMVDAGVDVFHWSTRRFWDTEFESDQNLAAWLGQADYHGWLRRYDGRAH
jgi:hypothetical protein